MSKVNVIGVGMIKFAKPGASDDYHIMAKNAATAALEDSGIPYDEMRDYLFRTRAQLTPPEGQLLEQMRTGLPPFRLPIRCARLDCRRCRGQR